MSRWIVFMSFGALQHLGARAAAEVPFEKGEEVRVTSDFESALGFPMTTGNVALVEVATADYLKVNPQGTQYWHSMWVLPEHFGKLEKHETLEFYELGVGKCCCPSDAVVHNSLECKLAVSKLAGISQDAVNMQTVTTPIMPGGCSKNDGGGAMFNTKLPGAGFSGFSPICKAAVAPQGIPQVEQGSGKKDFSDVKEVKMKVTNGETECADDDRIRKGDYLRVEFNGTVVWNPEGVKIGKVFQRSIDEVEPYTFQLGVFQVIPAWDKNLVGLCAGACVNMIVPATEGYGHLGNGVRVPPNSVMEFDICIEEVQEAAFPKFNLFEHLDVNKDGKLSEEEMLPFFKKVGDGTVPETVWTEEDKDGDHFISWEEFGGSKGLPEKKAVEDL